MDDHEIFISLENLRSFKEKLTEIVDVKFDYLHQYVDENDIKSLTFNNETMMLTMTMGDGTVKTVSLGTMVTVADFQDLKDHVATHTCAIDNTTLDINYIVVDMKDVTFTREQSKIKLIIPSSVTQGFETAITFRTGDEPATFTVENQTIYPVKIVQFGQVLANYVPSTHSTITALLFNDGINNNILIQEVR